VWSVQFSPDGKHLLTACEGNSAQLWDVATGTLIRKLYHPAPVRFARFSPDGRTIATSAWDDDIRVWDATTFALVHTLAGHTDLPLEVVFDPRGTQLVSAALDGTARLWDATTGAPIATLQHGDQVISARFSPDGSLIATASRDRTAVIWDAHTGRELKTLAHFASVGSVELSADGKRLVTTSDDMRATMWDVATGEPTVTMIGHTDAMAGATFSPDGTRVLSYSADGTARLWDAATGTLLVTFVGHTMAVWIAGFSPDGRRVVTGGYDNSARMWSVGATRLLGNATLDAGDDQPVAIGDDDRVRVASATGHPTVRESTDGAIVRRFDGPHGRALWSPDDRHVLELDEAGVRLWTVETHAATALPGTAKATLAAFSPDGTRFVLGFSDRSEIWSASGRERVLAGAAAPSAAAFSADGRLATTAYEGVVIWDASTGAVLARLVGHQQRVPDVAWSRDGRLVATAGGFEQSARIWDAASGTQLAVLQGHTGVIESVAFHPGGQLVVTAGRTDATANVWSVTGSLLMSYQLPSGVRWVGFTADGTRLVTLLRDESTNNPPSLSAWRIELDERTPEALAAYVRCRIPFVLEQERLIPRPTVCP
jgi:WD40 repeat protein